MGRKAEAKTAIIADDTRRPIVLLFPVSCSPHLGKFGLLLGFRRRVKTVCWLTVCYYKGVHCWILFCNHWTYADLSRYDFLSVVALCNLDNGLLLEHRLVKTTYWTTLCDCKDAHLLFLLGTHYWLLPSGLSEAAKTKTSDAKNSDPPTPQLTQT